MTLLTVRRGLPQVGPALRAWVPVALAGGLAACSGGWVERYNPFGGADPAPADPEIAARLAAELAAPVPGADGDWPRIAGVPDEMPVVTPPALRRQLAENLAAARGGAEAPAPMPAAAPAGPSSALAAAAPAAGFADRVQHAAVIYYLHGSTRLSAHDKAVLRRVADTQRARGASLRVVGHASPPPPGAADGDGGAAAKRANFRIALKRARAVADELARLGVPAGRIFVESRADGDPAWSSATPLGEAANRRTDIYFVAPDDPG